MYRATSFSIIITQTYKDQNLNSYEGKQCFPLNTLMIIFSEIKFAINISIFNRKGNVHMHLPSNIIKI